MLGEEELLNLISRRGLLSETLEGVGVKPVDVGDLRREDHAALVNSETRNSVVRTVIPSPCKSTIG